MSPMRTQFAYGLVLFVITALGCRQASGPPYSPQDAFKTFRSRQVFVSMNSLPSQMSFLQWRLSLMKMAGSLSWKIAAIRRTLKEN